MTMETLMAKNEPWRIREKDMMIIRAKYSAESQNLQTQDPPVLASLS